MNGQRILTLDGPAGVGKTSLAKRLAGHFGLAYLDSGAMFRATALYLGDNALELSPLGLAARLDDLKFALHGVGEDSRLTLCGEPLTPEIRSERAGLLASRVAVLPVLREYLKTAQRAIGEHTSLVAEGRDMGSVIFPQAKPKFFLDAAPEERARRRCLQLESLGKPEDFDLVLENIKIRDAQDRNRSTAPLAPAEDALIVDTTKLDLDGVFAKLCELAAKSFETNGGV